MNDSRPEFRIEASRLTWILGTLVAVLVLASLGAQFVRFHSADPNIPVVKKFYLDEENNLPTFFSTLNLLLVCGLLGAAAVQAGWRRDPHARYWRVMALIAFLVALDETASLHEALNRRLTGLPDWGGIFHFAWVLPGSILTVGLAFFFWRFLRRLPVWTRRRIMLGGAIFVGGALGLEIVGGSHASRFGEDNLLYSLIVTGEEALEMVGVVVVIHALVTHLARTSAEVRLTFRESKVTPEAGRPAAVPPTGA